MASLATEEAQIRKRKKSQKKRREKSKERFKLGESGVGPESYKKSKEYTAAASIRKNKGNIFHQLMTVPEGPGNIIQSLLESPGAFNLSQATVQMEDKLSGIMDDKIKDDVLFKKFWEEKELDKYYYSVPMRVVNVINDQAEMILYKIRKSHVKPEFYNEGARHYQDAGMAERKIGCLNYIHYGGRSVRIYDFPYTVPTVENPVELDEEWKTVLRRRYRNLPRTFQDEVYEEADEIYNKLKEGEEFWKDMAIQHIQKFNEGVTQDQFREIIMKEKLSWCYVDEQKKWVRSVFYMKQRGEPIKHVELKTFYDKFSDAFNASYECCSNACKKIEEGVQGCGIMGGRRKRTRRRRKKNRKKRTKKKARRRRRRKSSKRRRRRKR